LLTVHALASQYGVVALLLSPATMMSVACSTGVYGSVKDVKDLRDLLK